MLRPLIFFIFVALSTAVVNAKDLATTPFCAVGDNGDVYVFVVVDTTYSPAAEKFAALAPLLTPDRFLWNIQCDSRDGICKAVRIRLNKLNAGKPLDILDVTLISNMSVVSRTGNVLTLTWGPYRTFTLDLAVGQLLYRESGPTTEGRGSGECNPSPAAGNPSISPASHLAPPAFLPKNIEK